MKSILKFAVVVAVSVLLYFPTTAQERFTVGTYTVDGRDFRVRLSRTNSSRMGVISALPQYTDGYPQPKQPFPPLGIRPGDMKVDTTVDRKVFCEVLKNKLEALRENSEIITISYVFEHNGEVLDITDYTFPRNTIITPKELALIDKRLRREVKASFKGREYLQHPVIYYGREIRF